MLWLKPKDWTILWLNSNTLSILPYPIKWNWLWYCCWYCINILILAWFISYIYSIKFIFTFNVVFNTNNKSFSIWSDKLISNLYIKLIIKHWIYLCWNSSTLNYLSLVVFIYSLSLSNFNLTCLINSVLYVVLVNYVS